MTHCGKPWLKVASTLQGVERVRIDVGLVAEQQHQDGKTDGRFGRCHRENEEDEHLPVHIAQVVRERDKIHVHREQHQFNRHQQNDQILAIEKDANDGERKQHRAQRKKVAQGQAHALVSCAVAGALGSGACMVGASLTMRMRS